jgi:hypothetical protein
MKRGKTKGGQQRSNLQGQTRQNTHPIIIICHSQDPWLSNNEAAASFCSKGTTTTTRWQVIVHHPDVGQWWDRLEKHKRLRNGPPSNELCHVLVVYQPPATVQQGDGRQRNEQVHTAALHMGEKVEIASVALMHPPDGVQEQLDMALGGIANCSVLVVDPTLTQNDVAMRHLWSFQDSHSHPRSKLRIDQVTEVCEWDPLLWRWNGPRLRDLYLRLKLVEDDNGTVGSSKDDSIEATAPLRSNDDLHDRSIRLHRLRREMEQKAAMLLRDPVCEFVADYILGASPDPLMFGRVHALLTYNVPADNAKYLCVTTAAKACLLTAYQFVTATDCSTAIGQVAVVDSQPKGQFSIPLGNPMITMALLPALFPSTPVRHQPEQQKQKQLRFDSTLGSRRIWTEHMALKASILYLFEGTPGRLRDLAHEVVGTALPTVWSMLFRDPADESLLRALFHPDVMDLGRLSRNLGSTNEHDSRLIPMDWENMARIYTLSRFIRTLPVSMATTMENHSVHRAVASVMKVSRECVGAIVAARQIGKVFDQQLCETVLQTNQKTQTLSGTPSDARMAAGDNEFTLEAMEALGMLSVFLKRDRTTLSDAPVESAAADAGQDWSFFSSKILIDCAMYCGEVRWLPKEDEDEDGLWTCLACLHRWQKRGPCHAYQTRKLMHPMKNLCLRASLPGRAPIRCLCRDRRHAAPRFPRNVYPE